MPSVSVIVTTRNEAAHIAALLGSLEGQPHLKEVILVDAVSDDGTVPIAEEHAGRIPLQVHVHECGRGAGRNLGAAHATGDLLAFIDGDCTADPGWSASLVEAWTPGGDHVLVGHTDYVGRFRPKRAPVWVAGEDVSAPSCNLAYPKPLFDRLGGFDEDFVTAEDMDLNLRAVMADADMVHVPTAVVHARTRPHLRAYLRQAYEYGVGRAQLEHKHGVLARTSKKKALLAQPTPLGLMRLGSGYLGYRHGRRNTT